MSAPRSSTNNINKRRIDSPTTERPEDTDKRAEKRSKKNTNRSQAEKSSKQASETSSATSVKHPYQRLIKALNEEKTADALEIYQDNYDLIAEYINWNNPNLGKPGHITKKHLYQLALGLTRDKVRYHFKSYAHLFDIKGLLEVAKEIAKAPQSSAAVLGTDEEMNVINKLLSFQKSDITKALYKEHIPQSNPRETYFQRYLRLALNKSYKGLKIIEFFNKITNSAVSDAYNSIFDLMPKRNPRDASQTYVEYAIEQYTQKDNGIASPSTGHKEKDKERAIAMIMERLLNGPFRVDNKVAAFKKLFQNYSVVRKIFEAIPSEEISVINSPTVYNEILDALAAIESQEGNEEVLAFTPSVRVGINRSRTPSPAPDSETEKREEPRSPKGKEADSQTDDETDEEVISAGEIATASSQTSTTLSSMPIRASQPVDTQGKSTTSSITIEKFDPKKKNKFLELCKTGDSKGVQAIIDQSPSEAILKMVDDYLGKLRHDCGFLFNLKLNIAGKAETTLLDFYLDSFDSDTKRFEKLINFPNILCLDYLRQHPKYSKAFADHFHKLETDKKITFFLAILNYTRENDVKPRVMQKLLNDTDLILKLLKKFMNVAQKRRPQALEILHEAIQRQFNSDCKLSIEDRLKLLNKLKNKIENFDASQIKRSGIITTLDELIDEYEKRLRNSNPSSSSTSRSIVPHNVNPIGNVVIGAPILFDDEDKQAEEITSSSQPPSPPPRPQPPTPSHREEKGYEKDEAVFGVVPMEMSVAPGSPEGSQNSNMGDDHVEQGSFDYMPPFYGQSGNINPYGMGMHFYPSVYPHFYPGQGGVYPQPARHGTYPQTFYPTLPPTYPNAQVQEGKVLIGKEELDKLNNVAKAFTESQKIAEESKKKADKDDEERERLAKEDEKRKRLAKGNEELKRLAKENEELKRLQELIRLRKENEYLKKTLHQANYHEQSGNTVAVPHSHTSPQSSHRRVVYGNESHYYPVYQVPAQSEPLHTSGFFSERLHISNPSPHHHMHSQVPVSQGTPNIQRSSTTQGTPTPQGIPIPTTRHPDDYEQHPALRGLNSKSGPRQG